MESEQTFSPTYPATAGNPAFAGFDTLDPMKRALESAGSIADPNKKARMTPRSFDNYGYGAGAANGGSNGNNGALYSTGGMGMNMNGNAAATGAAGLTLQTQFNNMNGVNQASGALSAPPANNGQNSPSFPPSPSMVAGDMLGPYSAVANLGGYGMNFGGLMGMNGMNFSGMNFAGLASPGYAMSPTVGSFGQPNSALGAQRGYGSTAQSAAVAAAAAAAAAANNQTGRTVYIGNLPADASVDELLNLVHFGPLESVRVLPEKSCVFISFLDGATAAAFHADASVKKLNLHGNELKIGWGKASPVPSQVMQSIQQSNASRNVYLGGLDEGMTEEMLRDDLSRFGLIDQVKIVRDKNIGFVHFLNISTATKVVATLPTEPAWAGKRVNYGKDRCAYVPRGATLPLSVASPNAATSFSPFSPVAATGFGALSPLGVNGGAFGHFNNGGALNSAGGFNVDGTPTSPAFPMVGGMGAANAASNMNRTVYLGNIHPETSTEDLCNAIRGGVLQSIRYMQDKHIAFVTFVDAAAAFTFYQVATYNGLTLNNRRLKIGWGKNPGSLSPSLALSIHNGATRNVYIGNIEDFDVFNEDKLKRDFGEYGDVELVNFLKEKNCAFVNFTNVSNAIKAIDGIKVKPEYQNLRVAHGKDRCANPPRSGPQGGGTGTGNAGPRRQMSMFGFSGVTTGGIPGAGGYEGQADATGYEVQMADGDNSMMGELVVGGSPQEAVPTVKIEEHADDLAVEPAA
ncbi:hypothetical protein FRB96_001124 [Tulasnella sp. 330]|nr:hypothetical protein FRB96_001124 [Tulasnella sp. 330]KAG8879165.1 hypothetical protein FRB98_005804 [Tulasnella sp. 332]